jgi:glucokinase
MSHDVVVALDVGGTSMKGALCTRDGHVTHLERRGTQGFGDHADLVEAVVACAADLVEIGQATYGSVVAVGLTVAGVVDVTRGVAVSSMMLGWRQVPFVALLSRRTGLPVGFGHDVQTAAYAEGIRGAARGCRDYLYLSLGTGVGSTMVFDSDIYLGATGLGGELAHFVVEPEGPPCRCGKFGCLEMVASADAVGRRYQELHPGGGYFSAQDVVDRVRAGEPAARGVWNRAVVALGRAIATYVEILEPERVVVGGGMSAAGADLFDPLNALVATGVSRLRVAPVIPAGLGALAGIHGAALRAWERAGEADR